ncbi:MAG TPA: tripartite tricarboxylate transporter TctB family protein [Casimicrobiaceae bacterium]|jgi:putative tricarboxylic transport membrane protein
MTIARRGRAAFVARARRALPYVVVLAISIALFFVSRRIDFSAPGGRIGPDFWPKAILALAMLACAYQIVRTLFFADEQLGGVLGSIIDEAAEPGQEPEQALPTYPRLIVAGIVLTVAYVLLIRHLGFFLATLGYLAAFMWIGGFRRPIAVAVASLVGSLAFMFVFMKVVYVSLPLGEGPFSQVTFLLMRLMGIR